MFSTEIATLWQLISRFVAVLCPVVFSVFNAMGYVPTVDQRVAKTLKGKALSGAGGFISLEI